MFALMQLTMIVHRIRRHVQSLRKIPYGKHIIARLEKLTGKTILAGVKWQSTTQQSRSNRLVMQKIPLCYRLCVSYVYSPSGALPQI
jgi:hypothetical protein